MKVKTKLYVLKAKNLGYLSFDPVSESFTIVRSKKNLKVWDIQYYNDPQFWFMGNNPKPKVDFTIAILNG